MESNNFAQNAKAALENERLRRALRVATTRFSKARKVAFAELPDGENLRTHARAIKEHTINHLNYYLELLERNVTKNGGIVHWARDGEECCRIIIDLARQRNIRLVVKSKSMATEEIELNQALEKAGIKAVETDLGEYIIQLAHEKPSHIIAPAIHKSKTDVSELFSSKLGVSRYDEIPALAEVARKQLRDEFFRAGMGISGVNFAIAETGSIVIVENEGNARLCTTLPQIHVAVMGIEKIIPQFVDLPLFLKVLIRSATGQHLSSYVSFIKGPRKSFDSDGPEELHLVLLDNGRSKILEDEEMRESLYCLRCGACLNACPVYQNVGGHAYGWVYPGPIGAIITPQLIGLARATPLPYASSLCGACREVCPVKINIPKILLKLRSDVVEKEAHSRMDTVLIKLWALVMRNSFFYDVLGAFGRLVQRFLVKNGKIASLSIPPFNRWVRHRDLRALAQASFRQQWKEKREFYEDDGSRRNPQQS